MTTHPHASKSTHGSPPPRPWLPWVVAGCSVAVALGALALLWTQPVDNDAELGRLRAELEALQLQLIRAEDQLESLAPLEKGTPSPARTLPAKRESSPKKSQPAPASDAHGDPPPVPQKVLDAAVKHEIEERRYEKLERQRRTEEARSSEYVATAVDALVRDGVISDAAALRIEVLMRREFDETWDIKEAASIGDLSGEDARADWKDLVQETDASLREHLDEAALAEFRRQINVK